MSFQITGLDAAPFRRLYGLSDEELQSFGVKRFIADEKPGFPDRVELSDVEQGESVAASQLPPPAGRHALQSEPRHLRPRMGGDGRTKRRDETPECLADPPMLALRAFDASGDMVDADLADGRDLEAAIERLFANPEAAYIHAHYAKRGCYAARIDRA